MIPEIAKYSSYDDTKSRKFANMMKGNRLDRIVETFRTMWISEKRLTDMVIVENYIYFTIDGICVEDVEKEQDNFYMLESKHDIGIEFQSGKDCVEFIIEVKEKFANTAGPYYLGD